jgi:hypothetical protein
MASAGFAADGDTEVDRVSLLRGSRAHGGSRDRAATTICFGLVLRLIPCCITCLSIVKSIRACKRWPSSVVEHLLHVVHMSHVQYRTRGGHIISE